MRGASRCLSQQGPGPRFTQALLSLFSYQPSSRRQASERSAELRCLASSYSSYFQMFFLAGRGCRPPDFRLSIRLQNWQITTAGLIFAASSTHFCIAPAWTGCLFTPCAAFARLLDWSASAVPFLVCTLMRQSRKDLWHPVCRKQEPTCRAFHGMVSLNDLDLQIEALEAQPGSQQGTHIIRSSRGLRVRGRRVGVREAQSRQSHPFKGPAQ